MTGDARSLWSGGIVRWRRRLRRRFIWRGRGGSTITGHDIQRLELPRLKEHLYEMVKMSPLQSYNVEVLPEDPSLGVIGAGVAALIESKC